MGGGGAIGLYREALSAPEAPTGRLARLGARLARGATELLYPGHCMACGVALSGGNGALCEAYAEKVTWIGADCCRRCGDRVGEGRGSVESCPECAAHPPAFVEFSCAAARYGGPMRAVVLGLKFGGGLQAVPFLGRLLALRLRATALVDNVPLVSAWTNDSGFGSIFAQQLDPWLREGDVVIELSVHGGSGDGDAGPWSQNLVQAACLAKERGARVVGFSGFDGGALKDMADICLVVPVDEEPLGTPLVESYHVALHHLVCIALRLRITEDGDE
jgi:phosphoheptose isomerase